jgi:hypothetical protein
MRPALSDGQRRALGQCCQRAIGLPPEPLDDRAGQDALALADQGDDVAERAMLAVSPMAST